MKTTPVRFGSEKNLRLNPGIINGDACTFILKALTELVANNYVSQVFYFADDDPFKVKAGWQYMYIDSKTGVLFYHEDKVDEFSGKHFCFNAPVGGINHYDYKYLFDLVWNDLHKSDFK